MKRVLVYNNKGGIGKTTCSVHLALFASERRIKTLVVGLDRQGDICRWLSGGDEHLMNGHIFRVNEYLQVLYSPMELPQDLTNFDLVIADCPPHVEIVGGDRQGVRILPTGLEGAVRQGHPRGPGGLRSSEARALRWGDIDPRKGIMKIQHNYSDGEDATPKGGVAAPVGMSPELSAALRALPRGHKDDHVLTRVVREGSLKGQVSHHTPNTITYRLNKLQEAAGLEKSGPHRLRHACLTILAGRGTDPYRLQAHARHSRLSTTQKYIHLAREQAALEAAAMWGDPVPQRCPKKSQKAESTATVAN